MKQRLDQIILNMGFAPTKSQAKLLIQDGKVTVNGRVVKKPGATFADTAEIIIEEVEQYVSRGSKKIEAAIREFDIDPTDLVLADVGASTGGFTDFLLQHGASKVYAIDVGSNQLSQKLVNDPRVINMDQTNVKDVSELPEQVDLIVMDLSYISLSKVLPIVRNYLKPNGQIICLFKPQFECGPGVVNKQGVILDPQIRQELLDNFVEWLSQNDFNLINQITSPIQGKLGNTEYLLLIKY